MEHTSMNRRFWFTAIALGAMATAADADGVAIERNASFGAGFSSPLRSFDHGLKWPRDFLSARAEAGAAMGSRLRFGAEAGYDDLGHSQSQWVMPLGSTSTST